MTDLSQLAETARRFRSLHDPGAGAALALPNVWDVAAARVVEDAGAPAIATTSSGVAWGLGAADGGHVDPRAVLELVGRITAAVRVPVTVDIEDGYGKDPAGVAETVRGVLAAGGVGVNIEDSCAGPEPLRPVTEQAERIAAARKAADEAGVPLFVNARIDTFLRGVGDPSGRVRATLERARAYAAAGADGIFVPGLTDLETIRSLAEALGDLPLNVMAGPGAPSVPELAAAGARRVSLGGGIAGAAYAVARRAARELLDTGTYTAIEGGLSHVELQGLMSAPAE